MDRSVTIALVALVSIFLFSIVYVEFLSEAPEDGSSATGRVIGISPESATTLLGLSILFILVWFTWKERE